jgi:hypothetical protein
MAYIRVNVLARELGVKSKSILACLVSLGITKKKSHSSAIKGDLADKVREHFRAYGKQTEGAPAALAALAPASNPPSPARPAPAASPGGRSDLKQPASNTTAGPVRGPFARERVVPDAASSTGRAEAVAVRVSAGNPITITLPSGRAPVGTRALQKCPECGVPVGVDRLPRHLRRVHKKDGAAGKIRVNDLARELGIKRSG